MRQRLLISLAFILLIILLVGLNAASYVQKEKTPDSEHNPNRSTYNAGSTGTRALFDLLAETGRKVARWHEPPSALDFNDKNKPKTLVVVGKIRREFDDKEIEKLLRWVSEGGKLVIIDREPPSELITTTANWSVSAVPEIEPSLFGIDPLDQKQMTEKTIAAKPTQPTVFTKGVNAVQPSRFASSVIFEHFSDEDFPTKNTNTSASPQIPAEKDKDFDEDDEPLLPPTPAPKVETKALDAPVAHLANNEKTLLADFPFGSGQIIFLTDPYIVSNGGISLVDNAQLAVNIVASSEGIVAFDEYHQGYGAGENRLLGYFAGTPLAAIFLQLAILFGSILFTQSRRFARPLPADEPNRLSKLEYVSAMAELQRRTKAYDLAIENIYNEFRRRAARALGVDNLTVSRGDLAKIIAERAELNADEVENLMFKCEDIIYGGQTNKKEVLEITSRLRVIEEKLGIKRTKTIRR
ncbi:MAG: DUF4350 domain-containing protein [Acidobacteria bacterium]|nr:DUF4350 domain-containing protein [Acidobacteriota bacterium]MCA1638275.1 DUF4350 domain-containing protein [Acidobacteriota bacterium]